MQLSTKTIHNLLLNGTSQMNTLPIEVADFLQAYSNEENLEPNTTENVLKTLSIWSLNKKISYQKQGAILEQKPNSLSQNKKEIPSLVKEYIEAIFTNIRASYNKLLLKELILNFDGQTWLFPKNLIVALLNYGYYNEEFASYIKDILGETGVFLANCNKQWQYIFHTLEDKQQENPVKNSINEALIAFAKTRIQYNPTLEAKIKWTIDLPHMMTPTLKSLQIKERMYKDAGSVYFNFVIQAIGAVNPIHWIGENNPNKKEAYRQLLLDLVESSKGKKKTFSKEENLECAILRGLKIANDFYQDKDLIVAQYGLSLNNKQLVINNEDFILTKAKDNILGQAEIDALFADFPKHLQNGDITYEHESSLMDLLKYKSSWNKTFTLDIANALLTLYLNNKELSNDNYKFAYLFPHQYIEEIQALYKKSIENLPQVHEDLNYMISILNQRNILAQVYKK